MAGRWDWAEQIRERHFSPTLPGGYVLESVDEDTYWDRHEAELREHFPPDAYFDSTVLSGAGRAPVSDRLAASEGGDRLADNWLVHAPDGTLAGVFSTCQRDAETFELYHVTMHPDHRGRGLYRELLERVLAYAGELGFAITVSEHSPANNAVLIRHLKAGFRIVAFEISPHHGPGVRLAYFHDPQLLKAYRYRCGEAVMDESLYAAGTGHFALLDEQFAAARAAANERQPPQ